MRIRIDCCNHDRGHEVEVLASRKGLAITPWLTIYCELYDDEYTITHVRSGLKLTTWPANEKKARRVLLALTRMKINWTQSKSQLYKRRKAIALAKETVNKILCA